MNFFATFAVHYFTNTVTKYPVRGLTIDNKTYKS